jgi:hypothetical protein
MKSLFILIFGIGCSIASHASSESLKYIDYLGQAHAITLTIINAKRATAFLEDFNYLANLSIEPRGKYQSSEIPFGIYSRKEKSAALHSLVLIKNKEAATASRADIKSMLNSKMLDGKVSLETLCPSNAVGSVVLAIRDFGYLNYCLIQ